MRTGTILLAAAIAAAAAPAHAALVIVAHGISTNVTCASGVCTATAANAMLSVDDIRFFLRHGDLTVVSGPAAMDIRMSGKFYWAKSHRLTFDAFRSIAFTEAMTSQATGGVTLITNDGGSGGDLTFTGQGKIAFWDTASSLIIDGQPYALTASLPDLAAKVASDPGGHYALSVNVDASLDGTYAHAPVTTPFSGTFEGLGHIVDKMKISGPTKSQLGLFEEIGASGVVRDLKLTNVDIRNNAGGDKHGHAMLGSLAAVNAGHVAHVSVGGVLHASGKGSSAGGLIGDNKGAIEDCSAAAAASAADNGYAGGLVAWNENSIVSSSASGDVSIGIAFLHGAAGGLVGRNDGSVDASQASGAVEGAGGWNGDVHFTVEYLGGLVGTGGTVTRSFATGNVTGGSNSFAGGLAGYHVAVTDSYATGALNCECDLGGLIGGNLSGDHIATSYSTVSVTAVGHPDIGGFIGDAFGSSSFTDDYWDLDTSTISDPSKGAGNIANVSGITGLTDAQLKSGLPTGFNPAVWGQDSGINGGYPYLLANPPE